MKPLYMWAGGKNKMLPRYEVNPGIPRRGYDTYVEPFFGGGAMMIWVHKNCPDVRKFVMNDVNPEIVGIYTAIKTDLDCFFQRLDELESQYLPLTKADRKKFYYDIRGEYTTQWQQWQATQESATLYFLMKTGFNGVWQVNQQSNGRFATPCGLLNHTHQVYDKHNVAEWNEFLQRVDIFCGDWSQCCAQITGPAFYFMDPPYRDSFTQYGQCFDDQAHEHLIRFCQDRDLAGDLVFYCNRDAGDDFVDRNQGSLSQSRYPITYTAGRRKRLSDQDGKVTHQAKLATEILLYSSRLSLTETPDQENSQPDNLFDFE